MVGSNVQVPERLMPVVVTDRGPRIMRDGRMTRAEVWGVESLDGVWSIVRTEDAGTPWRVTHRDVPGWMGWFGSQSKARAGAHKQLGFDVALGIARMWGWRR